MLCSSCGKTISQRAKFCIHCGEKVVALTPTPSVKPEELSSQAQSDVLANVYQHLLGKRRMEGLARFYEIDQARTLKLMKDDVSMAMSGKPILTQSERDQLIDEILAQLLTPKSQANPR